MKIIISPLAVFLIFSCSCRNTSKSDSHYKLPSVTIKLTNGSDSLKVEDISPGKQTIFFYISPDCEYCQGEIKQVIKEIKFFQDTRVFLITSGSLKELQVFCNQFRLDKYRNIYSGVDTKSSFAKKYKVKTIPFTAIFDTQNKLKLTFSGETDIEIIKAAILD